MAPKMGQTSPKPRPKSDPKTLRRSSNTRFPAAACVVTSSSSSRHNPSFPAPLRFVPPWRHSTTYPEDLAPVVDAARQFVGLTVPCLSTQNLPKDLSQNVSSRPRAVLPPHVCPTVECLAILISLHLRGHLSRCFISQSSVCQPAS